MTSIEPETHFRIIEPDQRSVANNTSEYAPTEPEQKDQLRFKKIQAAQDAGLTGGSHNGDDDSSTNHLMALAGLSLGVLGFVCGIDYVKARRNSKSSTQVNSTKSTSVGGYARVNDPNGAATF